MIRRMTAEGLSRLTPDSEAAVKLLALAEGYGRACAFLRFWEGEEGMAAALMGGHLTLLPPAGEGDGWEETALFLSMQPEIVSVRTHGPAARRLQDRLAGWGLETGRVMEPGKAFQLVAGVVQPPPRELYPVLTACFPDTLPPFDVWYADIHHRLRHGLARLAGVEADGRIAACAMTTAECAGAAVIGAVATLPDYRGRGYASACVSTLAASLQRENRRIFLSPKNVGAQRLYAGLGFSVCGEWGELKRPAE